MLKRNWAGHICRMAHNHWPQLTAQWVFKNILFFSKNGNLKSQKLKIIFCLRQVVSLFLTNMKSNTNKM